ncbi:MAG: lipoyl(octanoyl) transferase LipB [bacterium]
MERRTTGTAGARRWLWIDIPLMEYDRAWDLQHRLVEAHRTGRMDAQVVLFLEHPAVFTLGRRGGRENLRVSEEALETHGIPVIHIERGGNITFHGPGQLVAYPVIHLASAGLGVLEYVEKLEEVMMRTAAGFGVTASRSEVNRGVWVGPRKLGSVGIAVRYGIAFHGLALNVKSTLLEPFSWIHPCGLRNVGMTALEDEARQEIPMADARSRARTCFEEVFGIALEKAALEAIGTLLSEQGSEQERDGSKKGPACW